MISRQALPSVSLPDPPATLDDALRTAGDRLLDRYPGLETTLLVARDRYARAHVRARATRNERRYDAPPDPYRLLRVDPDDVERYAGIGETMFTQAGVVADGDWDRVDRRFEDTDVYRAYVRRFEEGDPWEATDFYARIVGELDAGRERWGCRTEAEFRDRCARLDELYGVLADDGYRCQAELLSDDGSDPIDKDRRTWLLTERLKDEIAVHVGRDGEFLFEDGRNRLAMAKLLGLDGVTVRVLRRHADWQATRDAYVRGESAAAGRDEGTAADYGDHPDLAGLEFDSV